MMTKGEKAKGYFLQGYNCSQSVALAFCNEINMSESDIARLTIGFGGGIGRMREVCGTISGITFVLSALYGEQSKADVYKMIQDVSNKFKDDNGSVICRELLGLNKKGFSAPTPDPRTNEYYKKRPCPNLVEYAADILDDYLKSIA